MGKIVARVFSDDAFAPKNGSDLTVANAHGNNGNDVRQNKVDDVVAETFESDINDFAGKWLANLFIITLD